MASKKTSTPRLAGNITVDLGRPNSAPQRAFFKARAKYVLYGGARGGGKSWAIIAKAVGMALKYEGIHILIIRRAYTDMYNSLIEPLVAKVPPTIGQYNSTMHTVFFFNGSMIKFGHLPGYGAAAMGEYQGQSWDCLFIDELTQFLETEFRALAAVVRGVNDFPKRIMCSANPGGIGHSFVKRLWIDRNFKPGENPDDYVYIKATVDDNVDLLRASPDYVAALDLLPEDIRRAHRYGDWDALAGTYFPEFRTDVHVFQPFRIPAEWPRYRAFDYGLDMFACLWVAVDFTGRCWVYREFAESNMIVSEAANAMLDCTPEYEHVQFTVAPPDMWNRQKDTGKSMADVFQQNGVGLIKASNSRVQGWLQVKELLKLRSDNKPGLMISADCKSLIEYLPVIQHDPKNPSDCAKEPHEITHVPDALRYFCVMRTLPAIRAVQVTDEDEDDLDMEYSEFMCGGVPSASYIGN